MSQCVGDDVDPEARAFNLVDGETDAVERHRSFRGDVARQLRRCLDREADRVALRPPLNELRDTVDMPGAEMAAKLVAEPQRALEIDWHPFGPFAQGGARQGLGRSLDRETAGLDGYPRPALAGLG